jgi:hypothetical protein
MESRADQCLVSRVTGQWFKVSGNGVNRDLMQNFLPRFHRIAPARECHAAYSRRTINAFLTRRDLAARFGKSDRGMLEMWGCL